MARLFKISQKHMGFTKLKYNYLHDNNVGEDYGEDHTRPDSFA